MNFRLTEKMNDFLCRSRSDGSITKQEIKLIVDAENWNENAFYLLTPGGVLFIKL